MVKDNQSVLRGVKRKSNEGCRRGVYERFRLKEIGARVKKENLDMVIHISSRLLSREELLILVYGVNFVKNKH